MAADDFTGGADGSVWLGCDFWEDAILTPLQYASVYGRACLVVYCGHAEILCLCERCQSNLHFFDVKDLSA
jgi:hypothetical protein